ncbi:MAG: hypothetical protein COB59_07960, partial [Rhodospirillaceae bacterium]
MRIPTYLSQSKQNIYYFRWPVSQDIHPLNKRTHIKASLHTSDKYVAMQLARMLSYAGEQLTNQALGHGMQYDEIRQYLKKHFTKLLNARKRDIERTGRLATVSLEEFEGEAQSLTEPDLYYLPDKDGLTKADHFIAQEGLSFAPGTSAYETLKTELLTAHKAALKELFNYYQSSQGYDFSNEQKTIVQAIENDLDFISINTLIDKYVEECKRGEVWNAKTTIETQSSLNLLAELLGDDTNAA